MSGYMIAQPETNEFTEQIDHHYRRETRLFYRRNRANRYYLSRPNDKKWDNFGYRSTRDAGVY